jgi:hypothetical protein
MIKDEKQRTAKIKHQASHSPENASPTGFKQKKQRFFSVFFKPIRQGVSQHVLDVADQMIEEYKSDLEYLKDK